MIQGFYRKIWFLLWGGGRRTFTVVSGYGESHRILKSGYKRIIWFPMLYKLSILL
jgi:hypothetical protein